MVEIFIELINYLQFISNMTSLLKNNTRASFDFFQKFKYLQNNSGSAISTAIDTINN